MRLKRKIFSTVKVRNVNDALQNIIRTKPQLENLLNRKDISLGRKLYIIKAANKRAWDMAKIYNTGTDNSLLRDYRLTRQMSGLSNNVVGI